MSRLYIDSKGRSLGELIPELEQASDIDIEELEDLFIRASDLNQDNFTENRGLFLRARKEIDKALAFIDAPLLHALADILDAKSYEVEFSKYAREVDGILMTAFAGKKLDKVFHYVDHAKEMYPDYWYSYWLRFQLLIRRGDWSGSLEELNTLREKFDENLMVIELFKKDEFQNQVAWIEDNAEKQNKCFVATVVYDSHEQHKINVLRGFRDKVLRRSDIGKKIILFYYSKGPALARYIKERRILKQMVKKFFFAPIVASIQFFGR